MIGPLAFTSAKAAVHEMIAAGAMFCVRRCEGTLGSTVTYRVQAGGDVERCRAIITAVKARPKQFGDAFRCEAAKAAAAQIDGGSS